MMVAMTAMLVSVAELSSIFSVVALVICFCAVFLFVMRSMMVLRLHGEELVLGSSVHQVQRQIPRMQMMKVHIPFTFKLADASTASYAELQCVVSSQVPYTLQALWGVSIRELHLFLWRPWAALRSQAEAGALLHGHHQRSGRTLQKTSHTNEVLTLSLPQPALDLGKPPRLCYPLVIFLIRNDPRPMNPDETVALINVVHIKDSVCTLPTSILAQYLKQANGQLSCLKQLYLATGNPLSYEDEPPAPPLVCAPEETEERTSSAWTAPGEQLCVVCQYFPLSRALLPCRHTCICASCFSRLERCPMCRSPIRSYFCIRGEEYMPSETRPQPTTKPPPVIQWLQDLNDRLTDLLGFQR